MFVFINVDYLQTGKLFPHLQEFTVVQNKWMKHRVIMDFNKM